MSESPRAQTKAGLSRLREGGDFGASTEQGHVKAEIYAIAAYFIEKATSKAAQWLEDHPNKGLANEINNFEILTINSSVVPVENIKEYLSDTDLRVVLEKSAH